MKGEKINIYRKTYNEIDAYLNRKTDNRKYNGSIKKKKAMLKMTNV